MVQVLVGAHRTSAAPGLMVSVRMGPENENIVGEEMEREKGIFPNEFPMSTPGVLVVRALGYKVFFNY